MRLVVVFTVLEKDGKEYVTEIVHQLRGALSLVPEIDQCGFAPF
jgi:hypothetical protein